MSLFANSFTYSCRALGVAVLFFGAVGAAGCMDITGRGPAPLAKTLTLAVEDSRPRAGHVYCMRGWLGIFSTGMDVMAGEIDKEVTSVSVADEEWRRLKGFLINENKAGKLKEPLVLVGHSWGADDQIRVAQELGDAGISVDLLITIDPVTPPVIPPNVKRSLNIYKSHPVTDGVPFWRGVPIDPATTKVPVTNIDLREAKLGFDTETVDHINIEKSPGVHEMVLEAIRQVCPLRTASVPAPLPMATPVGPGKTPTEGHVSSTGTVGGQAISSPISHVP